MTTHYTTADAHVDRFGNTRAVCGRRVNEQSGETSLEPTCDKCRQWLSRRDEEPLPSWAREAGRLMGILDGLNLPSLHERPRGGWPDTQAKAKTRLEAKDAKRQDDSKDEKKAKATVWKLDGGCCRWCKRKVRRSLELIPNRAEFHHVSGKVIKTIRWDIRNLILLCLACHERLTGKVAEKVLLVSKHVFSVDGVEYINARKACGFQRVA